MRVPDLEQMICEYEDRKCKNCGRTKVQHMTVFVMDGPYSVAPVYQCMVSNKYGNLSGVFLENQSYYEVQEC